MDLIKLKMDLCLFFRKATFKNMFLRDEFESVVVRWINLEPVIQGEVSQREKNKYHILTHVYGI